MSVSACSTPRTRSSSAYRACLAGSAFASTIDFAIRECYSRIMADTGSPIHDTAHLMDALNLLGALLAATSDDVAVAVVGGSALLLNGHVTRVTRDVDVVAFVQGDALSNETESYEVLQRHVSAAALELGLDPDWLNLGPTSLLDAGLPEGFLARCRVERFGGLTVYVADRYDMIHMKLFAAVDQGPESKHMKDLMALEPSREELHAAGAWCRTQDVSEAFARELEAATEWTLGTPHE